MVHSGLANVLILVVLICSYILYKKNFCGGKNVLIFSNTIVINYLT